jgi:hypothetical protein
MGIMYCINVCVYIYIYIACTVFHGLANSYGFSGLALLSVEEVGMVEKNIALRIFWCPPDCQTRAWGYRKKSYLFQKW